MNHGLQLTFLKELDSITAFDTVVLPDFAVLTGDNASGKTHLLRAIKAGHVKIAGLATDSISFFDSTSFQAIASQIAPDEALRWSPSDIWFRLGTRGFVDRARETFATHFPNTDPTSFNWDDGDPAVQKYQFAIDELLPRPNPNDVDPNLFPDYRGTFRRFRRPAHLMTEADFAYLARPSIHLGRHRLSLELSSLFTAYKRNQYAWVTKQLDAGAAGPLSSLLDEYTSRFPPPWVALDQVFSELRELSGKDDLFNFSFTYPTTEPSLATWQAEKFPSHLKSNVSGKYISPNALSSGERTILTLLTLHYASKERQELPKLLLLDEPDAALHPSIVKLLLHVIERSLLPQGCKVILTTHSPTTVALAPDDSLFEVVKGSVSQKVVKRSKRMLLDRLTGEFFTLDLAGRIFGEVLRKPLTIFSEGNNRLYILRALEHAGIGGVEVFKGLEDRTSDSQLKTLFHFFAAISDHPPVLFVWDCDVTNLPASTASTHAFRFAQNTENGLCQRGIENLFDQEMFSTFIKRTVMASKKEIEEFDPNCKAAFAAKILASGDPQVFRRFDPLIQKVRSLLPPVA